MELKNEKVINKMLSKPNKLRSGKVGGAFSFLRRFL